MSSAADGGRREDSGEEADAAQDPDLAAMWQRFQHLTDKLSGLFRRAVGLTTGDSTVYEEQKLKLVRVVLFCCCLQ